MVGIGVGEVDSRSVGVRLGASLGVSVGTELGVIDCSIVGEPDDAVVGATDCTTAVGIRVGEVAGSSDETSVGKRLGAKEGVGGICVDVDVVDVVDW